jgi:hypothetical protein
VKLLVPVFAWSSKASPLSAVTVWAAESSFVTLIFAPGATDAGVVYLKSLIVMVSADEPPDPPAEEPFDDPDDPQAVAVRSTAQAQDTTVRLIVFAARVPTMAVLALLGTGRR